METVWSYVPNRMRAENKNIELKSYNALLTRAVVFAALIFLFDLSIPLGVAAGVPYMALVLLGLWHPDKRVIFILAALGSVLTILGYFLSAPAGLHWMVVFNRGLALFAIWVTAFLSYQRKQYETTLSEALRNQEQKVHDRTQNLRAEIKERRHVETALRASEHNFRTLMEQASDAIFVFNDNGKVLDLNSAARELLALPDNNPLSDLNYTDILPSQNGSDFDQELARLQAGQVVRSSQSIHCVDGSSVPVEISAKQLSDGRIHVIARNISERLASEERDRLHQSEIARAWRIAAIGEMSTVLAHELNQPLTVISGSAQAASEFLQAHTEPEKCPDMTTVREGLRQVLMQAERANAIIRRVRAFIRKEPPRRRTLNVNIIIQELAEILYALGRRNEISIIFDLNPDVPDISAERVQIEQVILNLARNAIEATQAHSGTEVSIGTCVGENGDLVIKISDDGPGVVEEDLDRIFDPFYTTKDDGIGIGLTICRTIVEEHGGSLNLSNGPDQGCIAQVNIPFLEVESAVAI